MTIFAFVISFSTHTFVAPYIYSMNFMLLYLLLMNMLYPHLYFNSIIVLFMLCRFHFVTCLYAAHLCSMSYDLHHGNMRHKTLPYIYFFNFLVIPNVIQCIQSLHHNCPKKVSKRQSKTKLTRKFQIFSCLMIKFAKNQMVSLSFKPLHMTRLSTCKYMWSRTSDK